MLKFVNLKMLSGITLRSSKCINLQTFLGFLKMKDIWKETVLIVWVSCVIITTGGTKELLNGFT